MGARAYQTGQIPFGYGSNAATSQTVVTQQTSVTPNNAGGLNVATVTNTTTVSSRSIPAGHSQVAGVVFPASPTHQPSHHSSLPPPPGLNTSGSRVASLSVSGPVHPSHLAQPPVLNTSGVRVASLSVSAPGTQFRSNSGLAMPRSALNTSGVRMASVPQPTPAQVALVTQGNVLNLPLSSQRGPTLSPPPVGNFVAAPTTVIFPSQGLSSRNSMNASLPSRHNAPPVHSTSHAAFGAANNTYPGGGHGTHLVTVSQPGVRTPAPFRAPHVDGPGARPSLESRVTHFGQGHK